MMPTFSTSRMKSILKFVHGFISAVTGPDGFAGLSALVPLATGGPGGAQRLPDDRAATPIDDHILSIHFEGSPTVLLAVFHDPPLQSIQHHTPGQEWC